MAQASTPQADGQESRAQDGSSGPTVGSLGKKAPRLKRPEIDYDQNMKAARAAMKQAAKAVAAARALQTNEARKKQRLMKKASQLSSNDLERIAVMKRCGQESVKEVTDARDVAEANGEDGIDSQED